jgi:hypothetical protein
MAYSRLLLIVPVLALLALPAPAYAESNAIQTIAFVTGNELLRLCTNTETDAAGRIDVLACQRYVAGASDMYAMWRHTNNQSCLPLGTEVGQVKDATVKWLQEHIALRNNSGALAVYGALDATWNCPRK